MSAWRGVCLGGVCLGGVCPGGVCPSACWDTPPPCGRWIKYPPSRKFLRVADDTRKSKNDSTSSETIKIKSIFNPIFVATIKKFIPKFVKINS